MPKGIQGFQKGHKFGRRSPKVSLKRIILPQKVVLRKDKNLKIGMVLRRVIFLQKDVLKKGVNILIGLPIEAFLYIQMNGQQL